MNREPDPSNPDDKQGKWVLAEGSVGIDGKELDASKIRQVLSAVDRLQIVGVRPRPEQLTLQALQSKGFFVTPDGRRLFGNEGEVKAISDDGVVYTLYFGEITLDSGLALTAGGRGCRSPTEPKEGEEKKDANRFMFVDVAYDPRRHTAEPAGPPPDEPEGAKRAKQLQARFDKWFYVISDASFKQIHKTRPSSSRTPARRADRRRPGRPRRRPESPPKPSPQRSPRSRVPDAASDLGEARATAQSSPVNFSHRSVSRRARRVVTIATAGHKSQGSA
jgi:hypothetical protein